MEINIACFSAFCINGLLSPWSIASRWEYVCIPHLEPLVPLYETIATPLNVEQNACT